MFHSWGICYKWDCIHKQVQPKHVKEAFRLLNKSIIRVEQPDVHLEEEEEEDKQEEIDVEGIHS